MDSFRRNHFELKVKTIAPIFNSNLEQEGASPIYLYITKFFNMEDISKLELGYYSENLSLSIVLPKMPTNNLDKKFSSDFIIKHKVSEYVPSETSDLEVIYQDFYNNERQDVLIANEVALDHINGVSLEENPLAKQILKNPIAWVAFCHALNNKKSTSELMHFIKNNNPKGTQDIIFDNLPFVYEDVFMAFD